VRKFREREHAFLVEGADLVTAGMAAGLRPQLVFVRRGSAAHEAAAADERLAGVAVYVVTDRVAAKISTLEVPPDVLAVFPLPAAPPLYQLAPAAAEAGPARSPGAPPPAGSVSGSSPSGPTDTAAGTLVVYADRVADPGNIGTLVRAAAAFGAAALAASPGSVDLYAPKVVRAGMGAAFALPLYPEIALDELVARTGIADVYGLVAHDGDDLATAELTRPAVLCVGAERAGLSPETLGVVTRRLTIGLAPEAAGTVESLNAGVAGAVALYEFSRRRPPGAADDPRRRPPAPEKG
jgi:TrmH family RNA methyltransferase